MSLDLSQGSVYQVAKHRKNLVPHKMGKNKKRGSNKSNVASGGGTTDNKRNQGHKFSEKSIDELISNVDDVKKIVEQVLIVDALYEQ